MKLLRTLVMAAAMSLLSFNFAFADQLITASNVDSVKDNIPAFLYDWIKAGKAQMNTVDKLPYNPDGFGWGILPEEVAKTKANAGKYKVDDKRRLTSADGKPFPPSADINGMPFPDVKADDPMAGTKLIYNFKFRDVGFNPVNSNNGYHTVNADGSMGLNAIGVRMTVRGYGDYDFMHIQAIKAPYTSAGNAVLEMRCLNPEGAAARYAYNPGTRKIMRMPTKADGAEMTQGTIMAEDDHHPGATFFRLPNTIYKFKGVREFYVPYASMTPSPIKTLSNGGYRVDNSKPGDHIVYGNTDPNWKGYGWWPMNVVFAKRTVWEFSYDQVDEDPDRVGTENITWIDPVLSEITYKYIVDPGNKPFRAIMGVARYCETPDKKIAFTRVFSILSVSMQHDMMACWNYQLHQPDYFFEFKLPEGRIDKRFFTKEGFVKFGK